MLAAGQAVLLRKGEDPDHFGYPDRVVGWRDAGNRCVYLLGNVARAAVERKLRDAGSSGLAVSNQPLYSQLADLGFLDTGTGAKSTTRIRLDSGLSPRVLRLHENALEPEAAEADAPTGGEQEEIPF